MELTEKLLAIDPIVILLYLILSLVIGLCGNRLLHLKNSSEDDYYLAGRKMPGWLNGISTAATSLNSDVAPVYCGIAVVTGLSGAWFFLSRFGLALLIASLLFAVRWRQLGIKTGPEFLQVRFGRGSSIARVYTSVTQVLIGMVPWIGAGLIGIHTVAAPIFGIDSKVMTVAILLPVMVIYIWNSGFAGVVLTDAIQSCVIVLGNLVMVGSVLWAFGGPSGLAEAITASAGAQSETILSIAPVPGNPLTGPLALLAWTLIISIGAGSGVASDGQRLFSCRNNREAAKMGIWGEAILFLMLLMLMLPALGLLARHPELYQANPAERESAYGRMLSEFLPHGAVGLTVAALLAAVMSTVTTHLNYGSQTLLNDVYRPLFGDPKPGREVWVGRLLMLLIVLLSLIVVFASKSLLGIAITVLGLFGVSASFGWGMWWWWRVNFIGWCVSVLSGPVIYLFSGVLLPLIPWWAEQIALSEAHAQNMQILQALVSLVLNLAIWILVTLCTPPEDMETLKKFYLRARPMGCWGPVRKALIAEGKLPDTPQKPLLLRGMLTAVIGVVMMSSAVLLISALYAAQYTQALVPALLLIVSGISFKICFDRYIARLDEDCCGQNNTAPEENTEV